MTLNPEPPVEALLLCAGLGTRLRPLTDYLPKAAAPALGLPLLAYHLEWLARAGIRKVHINLHHLPDVVMGAARRFAPEGLTLQFHDERELLLGPGGAIANVAPHVQSPWLLVRNVDTLVPVDLNQMCAVGESGCDAVFHVSTAAEGLKRSLAINATGEFADFLGAGLGQPVQSVSFTGTHLVRTAACLDWVATPFDAFRKIYQDWVQSEGRVGTVCTDQPVTDLGEPAAYFQGLKSMLRALVTERFPFTPRLRRLALESMIEVQPGCYRHAECVTEAALTPPVWLGPGEIAGAMGLGPHVFTLGAVKLPETTIQDAVFFAHRRIFPPGDNSALPVLPG